MKQKTITKESIAVAIALMVVTYFFIVPIFSNIFNTLALSPTHSVMKDTKTGFSVLRTESGEGPEAEEGDVVAVHYVGHLPDGTVFDSSRGRGEPFSFTLGVGAVIKGWDIGIRGMKAGEKRILTIPPELGYGEKAVGIIPPQSTLIFDVEMMEIKK